MLKVLIASDHAGFELKEKIKKYFSERIDFKDFGTHSCDSVDYPDYIHPLAKEISDNPSQTGFIICGSANGVAMTANKHPNVRAAICWISEVASLARQHNDANILALPARFLSFELVIDIINTYLNSSFEGGRHQQRVDKINIHH